MGRPGGSTVLTLRVPANSTSASRRWPDGGGDRRAPSCAKPRAGIRIGRAARRPRARGPTTVAARQRPAHRSARPWRSSSAPRT